MNIDLIEKRYRRDMFWCTVQEIVGIAMIFVGHIVVAISIALWFRP